MKKALLSLLVVGLMATAANAAVLSMHFGGTQDREITVVPSDYITLEFWFTPGSLDVGKQLDNVLFKLNYVADPLLFQHFTVEGWSVPFPDTTPWDLIGGANSQPLGMFLEEYSNYGAAGDVIGAPITLGTEPVLLFDILLHVASPTEGPITLTQTDDDLYPTIAMGIGGWTKWPLPPPIPLGGYYYIDQTPLVIYNTPEPASLALLALGGLLVLRRR